MRVIGADEEDEEEGNIVAGPALIVGEGSNALTDAAVGLVVILFE